MIATITTMNDKIKKVCKMMTPDSLHTLDEKMPLQKGYAIISGGLNAGVFLSHAIFWTLLLPKEREGWFDKTQAEWKEDTTLSIREQKTVRIRLIKLGILTEKLEGLPAKMYFRVDLERTCELLNLLSNSVLCKTLNKQQCIGLNREVVYGKQLSQFSGFRDTAITAAKIAASAETDARFQDCSNFSTNPKLGSLDYGESNDPDTMQRSAEQKYHQKPKPIAPSKQERERKPRTDAQKDWAWMNGRFKTVFPGYQTRKAPIRDRAITQFIKRGRNEFNRLLEMVHNSDYLMARGRFASRDGKACKPVDPSFLFSKDSKTGRYRYEKVLDESYSNENTADWYAPKPEVLKADDWVKVRPIGTDKLISIRKADIGDDKRYVHMANSDRDGYMCVMDRTEIPNENS